MPPSKALPCAIGMYQRPNLHTPAATVVNTWLDTLPSPSRAFLLANVNHKHDRGPILSPRPRKRVALAAVEHHEMNRRQGQSASGTRSPSKRQRITPDFPIAEDASNEDVFTTPRAQARLSTASISDVPSSRSLSPVKMAEFASLQGSGDSYKRLGTLRDITNEHVLHDLLRLLTDVRALSRGLGVVTEAEKVEFARDAAAWEEFEDFPQYIDGTSGRVQYGDVPNLSEAQYLCRETRTCEVRQETEAAWNERVHYPLMRLVLNKSRHGGSLNVANITTARIQPSSLLPQWRSGEGLRSKLVDYAITLLPDQKLNLAYANLDVLENAPSRSLNCSCLHTILQEPIAVSIETKTQDGKMDQAVVQLFTWAIAQVERLVRLAESSSVSLDHVALPLLSAHGSNWRIYAITWRADEGYTLWNLFEVGQTDQLLGFYKVCAVLQLVMHWAQTDFRSWIHGIVPLTDEQRTRLAHEGGS